MNAVKLKEHAEMLEVALQRNHGKSKDVDFLATYPPLLEAISDTKAGLIMQPRHLDWLERWEIESEIPEFADVADRLAEFQLLMWGWALPREGGP
ncbi:hypothetical protein PCA20602_03643 [Pandoraea capi]|uniref:Uncharacterized protein n=1 Tax=Pandoraea capi TaxID=2508286 RepID=A0ABY6W654_9BURK|nr:hypothetical protein [Pandoraea capi]VVE30837.1 hypothetical protein PCA20602_03643 [Pandoraea capi]